MSDQVLPSMGVGGSGGTSTTALISIHAKFRKTLVMNDHSTRLPLNHKHLQLLSFLQNKQEIPLQVTLRRIHSRAGLAHF